ncbi:MAG: AraC family transcriptional regulator, partial [Thalassobius sp.]|nr:AraC family transcriptional regulator [Thalassovita sp.]
MSWRIFHSNKLLVISLAFILVSCVQSNEQTIKIGFSQCLTDHPWRDAMNQAMQTKAALYPNVDLTIYEAKSDINKQINDIESMINDGTDVIIISPLEPEMIVDVIDKAMQKNIPVIILDRKINSNNYSSYIGADNLEVGRNAAKFIASQSKDEIKIVELRGGDNSSPVNERSDGFNEIVENTDHLTLLRSIHGTQTGIIEEELRKLYSSLTKKETIFVFAFNDQMAFEAWTLARNMNTESNLKFVGVDGLNGPENGIELVRKGILEATLLYPTGGNEAIEMAIEAAKGKPIAKVKILPSIIIDRYNADIMKNQMDRIEEQRTNLEKQIVVTRQQEEKYYAQKTLLYVVLSLLFLILSLAVYIIYTMMQIRRKNDELTQKNQEITTQRNQIEKIAQEIKEVNEKKFSFFTGLSHEFKTPLTLIMSSIEFLKEAKVINYHNSKNELNLIENNSQRLLRLMNNLLDFRKTEGSNFNLRASKTNIYNFTSSIFNEFSREAKKRNITFLLECSNTDLELFIDRNLMDKVYFNLLSNAFKFTPDNGKIEVTIIDKLEENQASIIFKDNGIGIPEGEISKVFEPFFKGSNNRKNSTGIGLHLTKKFIDLHLGKISLKSIHGTEFIITLFKGNKHFNEDQLISENDLPKVELLEIIEENDEVGLYTNQNSATNEDNQKVLVVEDNKDLSIFLRNKLKDNYEISLSDGIDAIEKALSLIPDLIICDINLPDKNGFEICKILKKDLRTSHIPIVILTALSDKESYLKGLEAGADIYLTKPFNFSV